MPQVLLSQAEVSFLIDLLQNQNEQSEDGQFTTVILNKLKQAVSMKTTHGITPNSLMKYKKPKASKVSWIEIPDGPLHVILSYLPVDDIKRFAQCSKRCHSLVSDDSLWKFLFRRDWAGIITNCDLDKNPPSIVSVVASGNKGQKVQPQGRWRGMYDTLSQNCFVGGQDFICFWCGTTVKPQFKSVRWVQIDAFLKCENCHTEVNLTELSECCFKSGVVEKCGGCQHTLCMECGSGQMCDHCQTNWLCEYCDAYCCCHRHICPNCREPHLDDES